MAKVRLIFVALLLVAASSATFAADRLRIGVQSTGTFAWQLDVVRRHGLAEAANLNLIATEMASPDAGKLALNADTVDIAVVDWLWVARERALGMKLQFYPYSTAVGAIMTRNDSPIRSLADLKGNHFTAQEFLPEEISGTTFYTPSDYSRERDLKEFLKERWGEKYGY